jgi:hypothetical protein
MPIDEQIQLATNKIKEMENREDIDKLNIIERLLPYSILYHLQVIKAESLICVRKNVSGKKKPDLF